MKSLIQAGMLPKQSKYLWNQVGKVLNKIHNLHENRCSDNWLENQLEIAKQNMETGRLDPSEFWEVTPNNLLKWLFDNKFAVDKLSIVHGDFRPKNIIFDRDDRVNVIDWGFVDFGDPYYDLSIIEYYLSNNEDRESFYSGYGVKVVDKFKIEYYDKLSKFLNV
jgi:aminoglycoside phosphotransferase (APT) family kinase protein